METRIRENKTNCKPYSIGKIVKKMNITVRAVSLKMKGAFSARFIISILIWPLTVYLLARLNIYRYFTTPFPHRVAVLEATCSEHVAYIHPTSPSVNTIVLMVSRINFIPVYHEYRSLNFDINYAKFHARDLSPWNFFFFFCDELI